MCDIHEEEKNSRAKQRERERHFSLSLSLIFHYLRMRAACVSSGMFLLPRFLSLSLSGRFYNSQFLCLVLIDENQMQMVLRLLLFHSNSRLRTREREKKERMKYKRFALTFRFNRITIWLCVAATKKKRVFSSSFLLDHVKENEKLSWYKRRMTCLFESVVRSFLSRRMSSTEEVEDESRDAGSATFVRSFVRSLVIKFTAKEMADVICEEQRMGQPIFSWLS